MAELLNQVGFALGGIAQAFENWTTEDFPMMTRKLLMGGALGVGLLAGGILIAQVPPENVDPHRHPNLANAQHHIREAYDEVIRAQQANDWDMHGHAQHARDLLIQAGNELKASAIDANRR